MNTVQKSKAAQKPRLLTVTEQGRTNRWSVTFVPYIRLSGNWLQQLGFNAGKKVEVSFVDGGLMIKLVN